MFSYIVCHTAVIPNVIFLLAQCTYVASAILSSCITMSLITILCKMSACVFLHCTSYSCHSTCQFLLASQQSLVSTMYWMQVGGLRTHIQLSSSDLFYISRFFTVWRKSRRGNNLCIQISKEFLCIWKNTFHCNLSYMTENPFEMLNLEVQQIFELYNDDVITHLIQEPVHLHNVSFCSKDCSWNGTENQR